jgi:hypothetical protein
MASVSLSLPDIEQSVARPIIFHVVDQILELTQLPRDTQVQYIGQRGAILTPGSSIDEEGNRNIKTNSDRYVFISVTESYQLEAMQETYVHAFEHRPVFEDRKLQLSLRPIYTTSDVRIEIKYRTTSETECRRWMAEMLLKTSRGRDLNLHDLSYSYSLPVPFVSFLEDVWTCREAVAGYGDSFKDYILHHASDRLSLVANRAGEHRQLSISEKQMRVQGYFDFQGVPDAPSRDDSGGVWEISFNYKFSYQRPDAAFLHYPVSVHNQLLPEQYLGLHLDTRDPEYRSKYYSQSYDALSLFENDRLICNIRPEDRVIRLPAFDDFEPPYPNPSYAPIVSALILLDEDRQNLMSLTELDTHVIDSNILNFLKEEHSYLTRLYQSFFRVVLFEGDTECPDDWIQVDSQLNIKATRPLDLRKVYHVVFCVTVDPNTVLKNAFDRLSKHPCAFIKTLSAINELLRITPRFNSLMERTSFNPIELWTIAHTLYGNDPGTVIARQGITCGGGDADRWLKEYTRLFDWDESELIRWLQRYFMNMKTVQTAYIVAHKTTELPV